MAAVALFTRGDLAKAFSLILPEDRARALANEWFETYVSPEELDSNGYYLYEDLYYDGSETRGGRPAIAFTSEQRAGAPDGQAYRYMPDDELRLLLMGFGDFQLNLLSLVSPDLEMRIAQLRGDTAELVARRRTQTQQIVAAFRRR
jgi:hypothetical protein